MEVVVLQLELEIPLNREVDKSLDGMIAEKGGVCRALEAAMRELLCVEGVSGDDLNSESLAVGLDIEQA